jgi:hypothetical protein
VKSVADTRFSRWQGRAIDQLTVAIGLISGWSAALLALGVSLLKDGCFQPRPCARAVLIVTMGVLSFSALLGGLAVVCRLIDFRLTMRKVRKQQYPEYDKPLRIFGFDDDAYGKLTWGLFWTSAVSFALASMTFLVNVGRYLIAQPPICH